MPHSSLHSKNEFRLGVLLVAGSALVWSFGGTIARFIQTPDSWAVIFWRSLFAAIFLLGFLIWQNGLIGTVRMFRAMRWPSYCVAVCFAGASTSFVVALSYTTVANILLVQAGVPLFAALMAWALFREAPRPATWIAIAAVIAGIFIMVSETVSGNVSPVGDGLALLIAILAAVATVVTRRHADVRMTPAVTMGVVFAASFASLFTRSFAVSVHDVTWLVAFGALNLGAGLAMFALGVRLVPSALAALIGTFEPVLGPVWVWLVHGEVPSLRTIVGGSIVFAALFIHLLMEWLRQARGQVRQ